MGEIPETDVKILLGYFNAQIGREKKYRKIVRNVPAHKNKERLIDMCRNFNLKIMSTALEKKSSKKRRRGGHQEITQGNTR